MTNEDRALRALDAVADIETTNGRQLLAKVDALVALSKLGRALEIDWIEGHCTAIILQMTKKRGAK